VVDEPQEAAFEDTAPNPLFRALHLNDADAFSQVGIDCLGNHAGADRTTEIAGVLVEETMRHEDDPATPVVGH
jgi:hypothetical protein